MGTSDNDMTIINAASQTGMAKTLQALLVGIDNDGVMILLGWSSCNGIHDWNK